MGLGQFINSIIRDSLFKNAFYLISSSFSVAALGFIFWVVAAHYYSSENIGYASSLISVMSFISMLSFLGFDIALVKFIPELETKKTIINTCLTMSSIFSLLVISLYITNINLFTPDLLFIKDNAIYIVVFYIFTISLTLSSLQQNGIFIGFRKSNYTLIQTFLNVVRIALLPLVLTFGAFGIFIAYGVSSLICLIIGFVIIMHLVKDYSICPTIDEITVRKIFSFSFGNYIARICEFLPTYLLPIVVLNGLGAHSAAYFYIVWQIYLILVTIPKWISISLLVEGSYQRDNLQSQARKAICLISILLVAGFMAFLLFGYSLLSIFGSDYANNSSFLLILLCLSSFPLSFNVFCATIKRIQQNGKMVMFIYGFISFFSLIGTSLLMNECGINGVGYAWLCANLSMMIILIVAMGSEIQTLLFGERNEVRL